MPTRQDFQAAVTASFGFLADTYGLEVGLHPSLDIVTYQSPAIAVRISRERGGFPIDVDLRRKDTGSRYALEEILAALAPEEKRSTACSGVDMVKLTGGLARLAELCQEHLRRLLTLDEAAFAAVDSYASESRRKSSLESQYRSVRFKADRAWEAKDWRTARALYEESKPALRPYQVRRLDFLRKRSPRLYSSR